MILALPRLEALTDLTISLGDRVSLRANYGDLPGGSVGVVVGYYSDNDDLLLRFDDAVRRIPLLEVADPPSLTLVGDLSDRA
jgi:hypothetical protein